MHAADEHELHRARACLILVSAVEWSAATSKRQPPGNRGAQSQGTHRVSPATERLVSTMKIKTKIKAGAVYAGSWD